MIGVRVVMPAIGSVVGWRGEAVKIVGYSFGTDRYMVVTQTRRWAFPVDPFELAPYPGRD